MFDPVWHHISNLGIIVLPNIMPISSVGRADGAVNPSGSLVIATRIWAGPNLKPSRSYFDRGFIRLFSGVYGDYKLWILCCRFLA